MASTGVLFQHLKLRRQDRWWRTNHPPCRVCSTEADTPKSATSCKAGIKFLIQRNELVFFRVGYCPLRHSFGDVQRGPPLLSSHGQFRYFCQSSLYRNKFLYNEE
eukprot:3533686-Rhodomonas_salina.1